MNTATQRRASAGGEIGANGEFYNGGEFIATTEAAKKAADAKIAKHMGRKQEVEPYKWELPTSETARTINIFMGVFLKQDRSTGLASVVSYNGPMEGFGYSADELAALWNNGQRWVEPK